MGESIKKYILRLRLQRSISQLQNKGNKYSITDIAFNAGFECSSSYNKAFKMMFLVSPSDYKLIKHKKRKEIIMLKPIKEINIKDIKIYSVRNIGPYSESSKAWEKLMKFAYTNKIKHKKNFMSKSARMFGIGYDDPNTVNIDDLRYDACITNDENVETPEGINKNIISGGKYLVFLHKGPYDGLMKSYQSIYKYIFEHEKLRDYPPIEEYLNRDPRRTKPENLKTEIWIPIK
ncbi:MAG: AraC family transcriptional regulator [Candidatus Cloacimonadota bacterium]|nr:MAG: AraC family transcriptional regulator [Candidatus Cloacimonadota bacterium]